jgi:uncharacterized phage infection (PIP) family protein YhgE
MDANDLIMKNIEMLEKMQRQELQMLKTDFESKMKDLTLKFEKLDETLTNLKDMLDGLRVEEENKPLPTTEEQIAYFKAKQEAEDKLKNSSGGQTQSTLNTSMPTIETIKNNMN